MEIIPIQTSFLHLTYSSLPPSPLFFLSTSLYLPCSLPVTPLPPYTSLSLSPLILSHLLLCPLSLPLRLSLCLPFSLLSFVSLPCYFLSLSPSRPLSRPLSLHQRILSCKSAGSILREARDRVVSMTMDSKARILACHVSNPIVIIQTLSIITYHQPFCYLLTQM